MKTSDHYPPFELRLVSTNDSGEMIVPVGFETENLPSGELGWEQVVGDISEIVETEGSLDPAVSYKIENYVTPVKVEGKPLVQQLVSSKYAIGKAEWFSKDGQPLVDIGCREEQLPSRSFWQRIIEKKPEAPLAKYDISLKLEGACLTALLAYFAKRLPEQCAKEGEPALFNMQTIVEFPAEAQLPESALLAEIQNSKKHGGSNTIIFPGEGYVWQPSPTEIVLGSVDGRVPPAMATTAILAEQLGIEGADKAIEQIFGGTEDEVRNAIALVKEEADPLKAAIAVRDQLKPPSPPSPPPTLRPVA